MFKLACRPPPAEMHISIPILWFQDAPAEALLLIKVSVHRPPDPKSSSRESLDLADLQILPCNTSTTVPSHQMNTCAFVVHVQMWRMCACAHVCMCACAAQARVSNHLLLPAPLSFFSRTPIPPSDLNLPPEHGLIEWRRMLGLSVADDVKLTAGFKALALALSSAQELLHQ